MYICKFHQRSNPDVRVLCNAAHISSVGMKLDGQLNNSSQQITVVSFRKGKKEEHMLFDSCIGHKESQSHHKCS